MTDEEFTLQKIKQSRGPTVRFQGKLLAESEFTARHGETDMRMEVWETQGGALIAVSSGIPVAGGREDARVTVVKPSDDTLSMRHAVMDHFDWSDRARTMASRQLKWKLVLEVE